MFTAHWHQEDPGVLPAGDNTGAGSPTGVLFYEGDELGPQYRGTLLSAEAGRNVIFAYQPQPEGAGFRLDRKTLVGSLPVHEENYFWNETGADTRKWFRPSDVAAGTDGALYIADWYDPIVGGHQMQDKKGYGRIYRVTPKDKKLVAPVLDLNTVAGQVQALLSPAVNVRNAGFVRLKAAGKKAIKPLKKVLASENPYHRARAAWLLAQLGEKGESIVTGLLASPDPQVRLTAFRALRKVKSDVLPLAAQLAADPSPAVRREVAVALRDVPYEKSKSVIETLVGGYDGKDRYYLEALGMAFDGKEEAYFADRQAQLPADPVAWDAPTATLLWRLHPAGAAEAFAKRADAEALSEADRRQALVALGFMRDKRAAQAMVALTKSQRADVAGQALWWVNFRRANDWLDVLDWEETIAGQFSERGQQVLRLRTQIMDENRPKAERVVAALDLARDPDGGRMLVSLAAEGSLPKEIKDTVRHHIFNNPDQGVRVMASDYFRRDRNVSYQIGLITKLQPTPGNGQKLFATHCTTCHRHGAEGKEVGPDLTRIGGKFDKPGLLDAIINPSAGLAFGYEPWLITTKKGTSYYGFLVSDAQAVVIKDVAGAQHVIRKEEIATRKQMNTSLMPDPAALGLKQQDLADLAAYLMSGK
jgi:putative heme-binding domain-containing protein